MSRPGNNQTGVAGQDLPLPLTVIVADEGDNRLGGVPVTFTQIVIERQFVNISIVTGT